MPFGVGRFIGRNLGTIGAIGGLALGGPLGGMIGGAIGSGVQAQRRAGRMTAPESYDPAQGTALENLIQAQQQRNVIGESYRAAQAGALGPAAYLQSAATQGAGRAAARLAMEGAERERQQIASQAITGAIAGEQQRAQALAGLTQTQIGARQFDIQMQEQARLAEQERQQAIADMYLSLAGVLGTSQMEGTALDRIAKRGKINFRNIFGTGGGGGGQTSVLGSMGMG